MCAGENFPRYCAYCGKEITPQEYFVRAAANGFNTEEMGHEMTRQQMEQIRMESMKQYGFGPETMKQLKVCANCGATVPAEKQICGECGSRLPRKTLYQVYLNLHRRCPVCETVLSDNAIFLPPVRDNAHSKAQMKK